jgi:hypothetical protein
MDKKEFQYRRAPDGLPAVIAKEIPLTIDAKTHWMNYKKDQ